MSYDKTRMAFHLGVPNTKDDLLKNSIVASGSLALFLSLLYVSFK